MKLTHNGVMYDIENWEEFKTDLLNNIGVQTVAEIKKQIKAMRLQDNGDYKKSIKWAIENGNLVLYSDVEYATYLEYGTYAYWQQFGKSSFPKTTDPKKKDISRKEAQKLPKGMQPFAPFRRVLWNENKMGNIIDKAVKYA